MKKIVVGILVVILILIATCFGLKSTINSKIDSKIDELNKNGFYVNIEKNNKFLNTQGKGKIEVAYPLKVIEYLLGKKDDSEFKKQFEELLKIMPNDSKYDLLDGLTFEYDFSLSNISSKLDLNLYLVSLSDKYRYEELTKYNYGYSTINFNDILKNRELKINIDEKGNFKVDNISFISAGGIFVLRGINGDINRVNIPFMKVEFANSGYLDNKILVENTTFYYKEDKNKKIDSKLDIGTFYYENLDEEFNIKNLKISSYSIPVGDDLKGDTKISFEELNSKKFDYSYSSTNKNKKDFINVKKTSLAFEYDKLPYEKYKEFIKSFNLDYDKSLEKTKEFLEALSKSNMSLTLFGESENLGIQNNSWYKKLKISSNFELSKNLASMQFDTLNDILSVLKFDVEVDSESAQKALENGIDEMKDKIKFVDSQNKDFKLFKAELKEDGLYVNDVLTFTKDKLKFPKNSFDTAYSPSVYTDDSKISYNYEMLDKNTLRVNFKYKTSLETLSSGGIAVSFPQLTDDSKIKAKTSKNFAKLDVYKKGDTIYSGLLDKNLQATYLMIEGFDENWIDTNIEKEISLDIDVSKMDDYLEINLRGYSTAANKIDYELLPTEQNSGTKDQQSYYIKIADIDLYTLKNKK